MNELNEELAETITHLIKRTNDDFGMTLSGNPFNKEDIERLQGFA